MKKSVVSLLVFGALLLGSAQPAFAAENIFQRLNNSIRSQTERLYLRLVPGDKAGEAVYRQSMIAAQNLETANMNMELGVDILDGQRSLAKATMTVVGPFEMTNKTSLADSKQDLSIAAEVSVEGTSFRGAADMKMTSETIYFKVNEVPALPGMDLSTLKGKWLKTKNTTLDGAKKTPPTAEDEQKLKDAYEKLLKASQIGKAKKETKNNKAVYVIESTIPKAALAMYIDEVLAVSAAQLESGFEPNMQATMKENIERGLSYISEVKAISWFDRATFLPVRVEIPLVVTLPRQETKMAGVPSSTQLANFQNADTVNINVLIDLSNFNEPINFVEPTDAQDAQEFFSEMMGTSMMNQGGTSGAQGSGTTELPTLTPAQQRQLQQYQQYQGSGAPSADDSMMQY